MPELPEVETVKETLKKELLNKTILDVKINHDNIIAYPSIKEFTNLIKNQTIIDIKRRGKWILFCLNNYYLLSHLRMEGKYFIKNKNEIIDKHEHVIFTLSDNSELRYKDVRKFGKMYLIEIDKINDIGPLKDLGLEPFDENLTLKYLKEKYKSKSLPIKTVLLDQSIIVGIGNIYADEILFMSKINPLTITKSLKDKDLENIIKYTKEVLTKAIKEGGTTIRSYTALNGITGRFQQELKVHGKVNKNCPSCSELILKIRVGGRGTYYCPKCQDKK